MKISKFKNGIVFIIAISSLLGTAFTIDSRYAKQSEVVKVEEKVIKIEKRLDIKILKDRADMLQERIWKYEDRYEEKTMSDSVKELVRDLQKELDEITKQLDKGE
jgi:hypothetical protein